MVDSASRPRVSGRTLLILGWNVALTGWTLRRLYYSIPVVMEQFHGQFFTRYGGWDMTPATYGGFAYLLALVCMACSLSILVNRQLGLVGRLVCASAAILLTMSWIAYGLLWAYSPKPRLPGLDLPYRQRGILEKMLDFDGLHFLAVALVFFVVAAVVGTGPFSLLGQRIFRGKSIVTSNDV
jgi:hypothetical protein